MTIHKFQGFEAGHGVEDSINHLLVDPGLVTFEQRSLGLLYVALSRAKTIGNPNQGALNHGSNIYWIGANMCEARVTEVGKTKTGMCEIFENRKKWTAFLAKRKEETTQLYTKNEIDSFKKSYTEVKNCEQMGKKDLSKRIWIAVTQPNFEKSDLVLETPM